jgi:hypothetical protein
LQHKQGRSLATLLSLLQTCTSEQQSSSSKLIVQCVHASLALLLTQRIGMPLLSSATLALSYLHARQLAYNE